MDILAARVPIEYRKFACCRPTTLEALRYENSLEGDPYQMAKTESAKLELEEIYRRHNPGKLAYIPRLLEKYAGRESILIRVVRDNKYT